MQKPRRGFPCGTPRSPLRITAAIILAAAAGALWFPLNVPFIAGAFQLLWEVKIASD